MCQERQTHWFMIFDLAKEYVDYIKALNIS